MLGISKLPPWLTCPCLWLSLWKENCSFSIRVALTVKCNRIPLLVTVTAVTESVLVYILIPTNSHSKVSCENLMLNCFSGCRSFLEQRLLPCFTSNLGNQVELTLYPTNLGYLVQHQEKKSIPVTSCYLILNFIKPFSSGVSWSVGAAA